MSTIWIFTKKAAEKYKSGIDISYILPDISEWAKETSVSEFNLTTFTDYNISLNRNTSIYYIINDLKKGNYTLSINMFNFSEDISNDICLYIYNENTHKYKQTYLSAVNIYNNNNSYKLTDYDNVYIKDNHEFYYPNLNNKYSVEKYIKNNVFNLKTKFTIEEGDRLKIVIGNINNNTLIFDNPKLIYNILDKK